MNLQSFPCLQTAPPRSDSSRLQTILYIISIPILILFLHGCAAYKKDSLVDPLPSDSRIVDYSQNYEFDLVNRDGLLDLDLRRQVSVEHFDMEHVRDVEYTIRPLPWGWAYFIFDVFCVKYLLPFGFGFHVVDEHWDRHTGIFLTLTPLTAFTYPVLVWVGGSVFGIFLYSPITIIYSVFGKNHRGIWPGFMKAPNQDYKENIGYFSGLIDTFLGWLPFYPGFTMRYSVSEETLNEFDREVNNRVAEEWITLDSSESVAPLKFRVNDNPELFPIRFQNNSTSLPQNILDRYAMDETLNIHLVQDGEKLVTQSYLGDQLGIDSIVPRVLPEEAPALKINCRIVDSPDSDIFSDKMEKVVLIDIRNTGAVPAYELYYTIQTPPGKIEELQLMKMQDGKPVYTALKSPGGIELKERLKPGEQIRSVARFPVHENTPPVIVKIFEKSGKSGKTFQE